MTTFCLAYFFDKRKRPDIGKYIEITWLPYNNGYPTPNAYVGMRGWVKEHYTGKSFGLFTGNSWLIVSDSFRYKKIKEV